MCIDEFNGDNFDHGPHGFVGGGYLGQVQTNGRPIETTPVPPGTPEWGAKWKKAVTRQLSEHSQAAAASTAASTATATSISTSIRPIKDRFGRPLMRMTIDFHDNELKAAAYLTDKYAEIVKAMGAHTVERSRARAPTTSPNIRPRISTAARSWAPIRRPARSTAICRAGTCRTCS